MNEDQQTWKEMTKTMMKINNKKTRGNVRYSSHYESS